MGVQAKTVGFESIQLFQPICVFITVYSYELDFIS